MSRRAIVSVIGLTLVLIFTSTALSFAEFRGTDIFSNLTPGNGGDGFADKYPLSSYQLDYYVDGVSVGLGGVDAGGIVPGLFQAFSSAMFFVGAMAMRLAIYIFDWAFGADMLTGGGGLLSPLAQVVQSNYSQVVLPFLIPAVMFLGGWLAWKAVARSHKDVPSVLGRTLLFFIVSFAIAFHPAETIGRFYRMFEDLSSTIVSHGTGAKSVSDGLFETFVYRPWSVIQFGGLEVCTGAKTDDDGFPLAATDSNPSKVCHEVLRKGADGHGDYARRFVRYPHGSDERKAEYDALREGEAPTTPQFAGIRIDKTDAPAVDMMQADGALQRFALVLLAIVGMIGGILLIGLLSVVALFAQFVIALAFVASPFMVLAAILPMSHGVVEQWLRIMGKAMIGKLVYSILLMATLSTSAALMALGGTAGFLAMFFAQSLLYIGVFVKRKAIIGKLTSSSAAHHYSHHEGKATSFVAGAATVSLAAMTDGASGFASTMRAGWGSKSNETEQDSSIKPDTTSPPASAGRDYSSTPSTASPQQIPSAPAETIPAQQSDSQETPMLRPFREDLQRRMSQQQAIQESQDIDVEVSDDIDTPQPALIAASARVSNLGNFEQQLDTEIMSRESPLPPDEVRRITQNATRDRLPRAKGPELDTEADNRYYDR